ncbi:hypothetical protein HN51_24235 [Ectopseudomonas mendocina]|nr:hypothetical protein HN51_24235 [Pseudomonas mendocina]
MPFRRGFLAWRHGSATTDIAHQHIQTTMQLKNVPDQRLTGIRVSNIRNYTAGTGNSLLCRLQTPRDHGR